MSLKSKHFFLIVIAINSLFFCYSPFRMESGQDKPGRAPNYARPACWAALPQKKDSADLTVKGLRDLQSKAEVDVFYIHPTTYIIGKNVNANIEDTAINSKTDHLAIKYQATVFNGSCRVYAPRYREAEFLIYLAPGIIRNKALDIAYSDLRRAFLYYLKHYNKGRPFIIASHSQGTENAIRLCKEFLDNDSVLNKRLIATYLVGGFVYKNTFRTLCPCDSANQTNCYAAWNTVRWGELTFYGKPVLGLICVNPLTWKRDHDHAPASLNNGSVPFSFDRIDKGIADAMCTITGLLWVHRPDVESKEYPQINSPFYHILDYNLFYMNIRENVKTRTDAYFKKTVTGIYTPIKSLKPIESRK